MDTSYLDALLERVADGQTAPADAEFLRQLMRTHHYLPQRAQAFAGRLAETQAEGRHYQDTGSRRAGSAATVAITYVRERLYTRGELILQTIYRLEEGGTDQDRSRRLHVAEQTSHFICNLWDLLFDQVAAAAQYDPTTIAIQLDLPEQLGDTRRYVRTVAELVAYELRAVVTGTAPNPADFA